MKNLFVSAFLWLLFAACQKNKPAPATGDPLTQAWPHTEAAAKGTTVQMMMGQGDPLINRYISEWVVPEVKKRYHINLQLASGQGAEIVKILRAEKEAAQQTSALDLCWINGETFFQLRQIGGLFGPYTNRLPNAQYIDFQNPFMAYDFQQPVDGYECPWGSVQLALIYDSLRTPQPPRTLQELQTYIRAHPGKFTIPCEFTGTTTLLTSWLYALSDDPATLKGSFSETRYQELSTKLWAFINRNKPYFWRKGEAFPESVAAMHQLFANGELDFTMSNNDNEVDHQILQNIFPPTAKSFVFTSGTIQHSHFLGIPAGAQNKGGAMTVINFLLSPEAQLHKLNPAVWGDGTVLDLNKLPTEWKTRFENIPERRNAAKRADIQPFALMEPAPEYMVRLYEDFRKKVVERR